MDPELIAWLDRQESSTHLLARRRRLELQIALSRSKDALWVRLQGPGGKAIDRPLKPLGELFALGPDRLEPPPSEEELLPLLECIESAIADFYREYPEINDGRVLRVLEGLIERLEP